MAQTKQADVQVINQGTIVLFTPVSEAAKEWFEENVEDSLMFGNAYCCEPRYAGAIIEGAMDEGFVVN